jgi:photosystem II stability/assembly factor-like uncharacterized protein
VLKTAIGILLLAGSAVGLISGLNGLGPSGPTQLSNAIDLIQMDPRSPGTLLAGTASAQLFVSKDNAESWTRLPFPAALRSTLHAILIDPGASNTYWVAVSSEVTNHAGLFRSTDGGLTWARRAALDPKQVWSLAFWPRDSQTMAAGTADGVLLSSDGGDTWTEAGRRLTDRPHPVVSLAFDPEDRNTLYAGTPHLAWKTSDRGVTWHRLARGMQADSDIFSIQVDPERRARVFAGACSGVYRSLDGGSSWSSLERVLGEASRTYTISRPAARQGMVFAGTSAGLMRSLDNGVTWEKVLDESVRSMTFDPSDPRRAFVATQHGVLVSEDGGAHFHAPVAAIAGR